MIRYKYNTPGERKGRYVRRAIYGRTFEFCEVSAADPRINLAVGTCDASDLTPEIVATCNERQQSAWYACEWPMA